MADQGAMSHLNDKTRLFPEGLAGIIFDCDGVMIDSEDSNRYFYNTVLAALGLPPMTPEQEKYSFMATAKGALLKMVPPEKQHLIDDACRENIDYYRDILPKIKLMPGFLDFIENAHKRGLRMAIDTNRVADGIQRVLDFFSLPNYFDPVISASCAEPKPSPEGARMVCGAWQEKPARILFIGDSEDDQKAALDAGCPFAAFGAKVDGCLRPRGFVELAEMLWSSAKV